MKETKFKKLQIFLFLNNKNLNYWSNKKRSIKKAIIKFKKNSFIVWTF